MIKILKNVLSVAQIDAIKQLIALGDFQQGHESAGWHAKKVKTNQQWQAHSEQHMDELNHALSCALAQHDEFASATYAKDLMPFIVSLCQQNQGYGDHIDDALMQGDTMLRTDISCTIALTEHTAYSGGELVMVLGGVEMAYKLELGDAIIYPSTTLHRVNPVTDGQRIVALTWIESFIKGAQEREVLSDLDCARKAIMATNGKSKAFDLITKSHANLLRKWSQT